MPMPIYPDYDDEPPAKPARDGGVRCLRDGREGARTPDGFRDAYEAGFFDFERRHGDQRQSTLDRVTLIERLKRSQSPPWQAQPPQPASPREERPPSRPKSQQRAKSPLPSTPAKDRPQDTAPPQEQQAQDNREAGLSIERPRSALHSGDFRPERDAVTYDAPGRSATLSTSPVAPWHHAFPAAALARIRGSTDQTQTEYPYVDSQNSRILPSRTPSLSSLPSSFVLLPPTSPLVQQSNNTDLDFSTQTSSRRARSPERDNRRHTFSPQSLQTYHTSSTDRAHTHFPGRPLPSLRREGSFPYQAHQPRRSLSSFLGPHSNSTPQSPLLRPRRPSICSESSPLQHAPMVGSYEESILRGRMSTTPSRPLNFIAQIGVLGKGQCKPQLRCPAHVTLPFPAVFYSYSSGNGRIADNQPSPYVGLIDLENNLKPVEEPDERRRRRRHARSGHHSDNEEQDRQNRFKDDATDAQQTAAHRKREKMKRRSHSPKSPQGGSYRIPQKGQLQIVIKNPNKTAVKLFLVPYDLGDMEPGQKTFIRQRSYSAGPIIDMPLNSRTNLGTDRPEASLSTSEDPNDRPVLRYLIHLHICCPSKGRYFLYKAIRVVFANRVPDGKERLRNEIQLPDPRYSIYKPTRENHGAPAHSSSQMPTLSASEKEFRRRSAGFSFSSGQAHYDRFDGLDFESPRNGYNGYYSYAEPMEPIKPIPFKLSRRLEPVESRPSSRDQMEVDGQSKTSEASSLTSQASLGSGTDGAWDKRARGTFSPPPSGASAGLLAQRLKGLDTFHKKKETDASDA